MNIGCRKAMRTLLHSRNADSVKQVYEYRIAKGGENGWGVFGENHCRDRFLNIRYRKVMRTRGLGASE